MKTLATAATLSLSLAAAPAWSSPRIYELAITNLTPGAWFTPLLVATHSRAVDLFELGEVASAELQAMAEGGDLTGLVAQVELGNGEAHANPANGLLGPGETVTLTIEPSHRRRFLSVLAMVLPTNDGFVGLDAERLPVRPGRYELYLTGYDAGTEANDERLVNGGGVPGTPGIPGDPSQLGGVSGTGVAAVELNPYVHIHRGPLGDLDTQGGASDLNAAYHPWQNPVAKLTITVRRSHLD